MLHVFFKHLTGDISLFTSIDPVIINNIGETQTFHKNTKTVFRSSCRRCSRRILRPVDRGESSAIKYGIIIIIISAGI